MPNQFVLLLVCDLVVLDDVVQDLPDISMIEVVYSLLSPPQLSVFMTARIVKEYGERRIHFLFKIKVLVNRKKEAFLGGGFVK